MLYLCGAVFTLDLQEGYQGRGWTLERDTISLLCATFLVTDRLKVVRLTFTHAEQTINADVVGIAATLLNGTSID